MIRKFEKTQKSSGTRDNRQERAEREKYNFLDDLKRNSSVSQSLKELAILIRQMLREKENSFVKKDTTNTEIDKTIINLTINPNKNLHKNRKKTINHSIKKN